MAALEVVKRRLDAVGLGDACLELHSHKTNKKELCMRLSARSSLVVPKFTDETSNLDMLSRLRDELNTYAEAVNQPVGESGYSPQMLIGELALLVPLAPEEGFPTVALPGGERWTRAEFEKYLYPLQKLEAWCRERGIPTRHLFWGSQLEAILPSSERALVQALANAVATVTQLETLTKELAPAAGVPYPKMVRASTNSLRCFH